MDKRPVTRYLTKRTPEEVEASRKATEERAAKWKAEAEERERMSVSDAITKLRTEAAEKTAEAERLEKLRAQYPDLVRQVGRHNKVAYTSKSVNTEVDDFEQRYNCGCCGDSPLEVWPYKTTDLGRVSSYPAYFTVGEKNYLGGASPSQNWEVPMRAAGIPEALIERVKAYFKQCRDDIVRQAEDLYKEAPGEPDPLL